MLHANANRVVLEYISIVLLNACCAPAVILPSVKSFVKDSRISLIKDNDLVPSCWEGHFSLRKRLDLVPHYIYTTAVSHDIQG